MKTFIGPYNVEMQKMGFKDIKGNWWPKFRCKECQKWFNAFLEDIVLGEKYLCPICGKYSPEESLEELEDNQRWRNSFEKKRIQKGEILFSNQKEISKKINSWKLNREMKLKCMSKGEKEISQILEKNNITFYTQYSFEDCKNPKTEKILFFDFYLPEYNCCIEYDGEQHYKSIEYFGGEERFKEQKYRDNIKNQYCKKNNISLIRIKYTENDIEKYLLLKLKTC